MFSHMLIKEILSHQWLEINFLTGKKTVMKAQNFLLRLIPASCHSQIQYKTTDQMQKYSTT